MFVVVKFGEHEQAVFNPDCKTVSLLDEIRCKCKLEPWAEIELSDQSGNPKDLREHLHRYASELLKDKEVYVLLQVENEGKSIRYVPMTDDSEIISTEFLERLESRQIQRIKNGKTSAASKRSNGKSAAPKSSRKSLQQSRGSITNR